MDLSTKKCIPCSGGVSPIPASDINKYFENINGWQINSKGEIEKEFKFKNFRSALEFVNKVGQIAEEEKHHPDIEFGWGYCKMRLITHSIGGLHENDFIIAAKIERIND